jgi:hypothetical protein
VDNWRQIGDPARTVIGASGMVAMLRGSFGPREFAVVFFSGRDVGFVRFSFGLKDAEKDALGANTDGGLVVSSARPELGAFEAPCSLGSGIEAILLMRDGAQVDDPVVRPIAVDVINEPVSIRAVVQEPRDTVTLQYPPLEHDREVLAGAYLAAQRAWLKLVGLVAANACEHPALRVEGEVVTNLGRR